MGRCWCYLVDGNQMGASFEVRRSAHAYQTGTTKGRQRIGKPQSGSLHPIDTLWYANKQEKPQKVQGMTEFIHLLWYRRSQPISISTNWRIWPIRSLILSVVLVALLL